MHDHLDGRGTATAARGRDGVSLSAWPVRVETGGADEEGWLVFRDGKVVAVLVRLSEQHGDTAGRWFLEHGFGGLNDPAPPCFHDLDAARVWIAQRLGGGVARPA